MIHQPRVRQPAPSRVLHERRKWCNHWSVGVWLIGDSLSFHRLCRCDRMTCLARRHLYWMRRPKILCLNQATSVKFNAVNLSRFNTNIIFPKMCIIYFAVDLDSWFSVTIISIFYFFVLYTHFVCCIFYLYISLFLVSHILCRLDSELLNLCILSRYQ